jgi:signal transduction histidine kinase
VALSSDSLERHRKVLQVPEAVLAGERVVVGPSRLIDRASALQFWVPIPREESCRRCHYPAAPEMAALQVTVGTDMLVSILRASSIQIILIAALTLAALLVGLLLLFRREIDRPVSEILSVIRRAKAGQLEARVAVRVEDELGAIGAELNRMFEQLQGARQELQSLYRSELERQERLATIGNLASAVAHEIKNPLAGIRGGIEVLEQGLPPQDPRRQMTRAVVEEVDRINRMVRDLLSYSRKPEPQTVAADLEALVTDVVAQARQLPDAARYEIIQESPDGAPKVAIDYQLIKQAFFNIIQNAFDAMPAGGRLRVRTWGERRRAFVSFSDTGGGIPPDTARKILQPFFTTRHRGTGLGLPIALSIVQAHGGELSFESRPGNGTTFIISFPALPDDPPGVSP